MLKGSFCLIFVIFKDRFQMAISEHFSKTKKTGAKSSPLPFIFSLLNLIPIQIVQNRFSIIEKQSNNQEQQICLQTISKSHLNLRIDRFKSRLV